MKFNYPFEMDQNQMIDRLYKLYKNRPDMIVKIVNTLTMDTRIDTKTIKERKKYIDKYRKKLKKLQNIPMIVQRSDEWYNVRNEMITASDFAQCIGKGKFATQKDFFKKKSGYDTVEFNLDNPALKWGCKYEDVACEIYKKRAHVDVHEFGLIQHKQHAFLGASPDGITDDGIMLEIKCPWRRQMNNTIPEQYYYQIQGQLEVCDLEECDYLECKFVEFSSEEEFLNDVSSDFYGIIIETITGKYKYYYGKQEIIEIKKNESDILNVFYWKLAKYNVQRIYRDKTLWDNLLLDLQTVWDKVCEFRLNKQSYDNYIQTRRPKIINYDRVPDEENEVCLKGYQIKDEFK